MGLCAGGAWGHMARRLQPDPPPQLRLLLGAAAALGHFQGPPLCSQ